MRKILIAAIALTVTPLFAGKRIEMEATDLTSNKATPSVILLDAERMRVDQGNTSVMLLTKGGNRILILDKGRNEYREVTQADIDQIGGALTQMQEMMKNIPPAQRAQMEAMMKGKMGTAAPATIYTAKGDGNVNGFRCTNYDGMQGGQKVAEVCAAQPSDIKITPADFQVVEKMRDMFAGLAGSIQNSPLANIIPAGGITEKGINGFPVQSTSFRNGQPSSRNELKSVTDASLSDADFSTGAAKKVDLGIGGGGKGK